MPLLADLDRESPRKRCTSAKDLSLLAVKGVPDRCDEKDAPEGPGTASSSLPDEEPAEWVREVARLRSAIMRVVGSVSDTGKDLDRSSLPHLFSEPVCAAAC